MSERREPDFVMKADSVQASPEMTVLYPPGSGGYQQWRHGSTEFVPLYLAPTDDSKRVAELVELLRRFCQATSCGSGQRLRETYREARAVLDRFDATRRMPVDAIPSPPTGRERGSDE